MPPAAVVRYGRLRHIAEFRLPEGLELGTTHAACVVRTPRGVELGQVLASVDSTPDAELVRLATDEDLARDAELRAEVEDDQLPRVREALAGQDLQVVTAERLLGGEQTIIYYTSSERVPVPQLLRKLEELLVSEVTLQHVGARQRARLCGGCGVCGRALCCSTFLRRMRPVTMRMAKVQGLDLSPRVTAGACGRLKCCLRFEHPLYEERSRGLPRVGWQVRTQRVSGKVLALDTLRRKLLVQPEKGLPRSVFADEVEHATPPRKQPLPVAGAPDPEPEPEPSEPEVEPGWSTLAKRLWRRVNPRRTPDEPSED